jgi:hypothetical protein
MERVEDFMQKYFAAQIEFHRAKALAYRPFRHRFFVEGYEPFNPYEMVHACEAERITSITQSDSAATVMTSTVYHSLQPEFRYHLETSDGAWLIARIEQRCMVCGGKGHWKHEQQCTRCKGTGWMALAA